MPRLPSQHFGDNEHKHKYVLVGSLKTKGRARRYKFRCNRCFFNDTIEKTLYEIWHPVKMVSFGESNIQYLMTKYETLCTLEEFYEMLKEHRKNGRTMFYLRVERGMDGVWRQKGPATEQEMIEWSPSKSKERQNHDGAEEGLAPREGRAEDRQGRGQEAAQAPDHPSPTQQQGRQDEVV